MRTVAPQRHVQASWAGKIQSGLGWSCFTGRAGDNRPHAHHAYQILVADFECQVWVEKEGWIHSAGLIIRPNIAHQITPTNDAVTLCFVDPETRSGAALRRRCETQTSVLSGLDVAEILQGINAGTSQLPSAEWIVSVLAGSEDTGESPAFDALVAGAIEALPNPVPSHVTAATMAASVGLSTSRFQHRFRAGTGMPVRPYLRWRRLLIAIAAILRGDAFSRAAHDAGFADAAHLSRTLRRHFGVSPKSLARLSTR